MESNFIDWFCDKVWTKIDPQEQILHIQLDITNACNLRCAHCYCTDHKNEGALTFDQWCQILDQYEALLEKLHMTPSIVICGGEPLATPFFFPLLKHIREQFRPCRLDVLSNGTLITKEIAEKLGISQKTVKNHVSRIFQTLHVNNRTKAALYVLDKMKP